MFVLIVREATTRTAGRQSIVSVMLPAPPPMSDRDEVIALLRAWHEGSPDVRADPTAISITSIVAAPIYRIAITRIAEQRGVRARPKMPGPRGIGATADRVDPWHIADLTLPAEARTGRRKELEIEGAPEISSDCERCRGEGKCACGTCNGTGRVGHGKHQHTCHSCNGAGRTICASCGGLGAFVGPQVAWAEIVEGTNARVVRPSGIPDQAVLDLDAAIERGGGAVLVKDDAWSGVFDPSLGARDPSAADALAGEVQALLAEVAEQSLGQARGHRLEIRRAAVYRVSLADGRSFLLWGRPARVSPENALDEPNRALMKTAGLFAIALVVTLVMLWIARHH
jgi:hypothetical protein